LINVKAVYTQCHRIDPDTGEPNRCDPEEAWELLENTKQNRQARLIESDDRSVYTVRMRDAVLYELRRPQEVTAG
jgi:hypothetical protein